MGRRARPVRPAAAAEQPGLDRKRPQAEARRPHPPGQRSQRMVSPPSRDAAGRRAAPAIGDLLEGVRGRIGPSRPRAVTGGQPGGAKTVGDRVSRQGDEIPEGFPAPAGAWIRASGEPRRPARAGGRAGSREERVEKGGKLLRRRDPAMTGTLAGRLPAARARRRPVGQERRREARRAFADRIEYASSPPLDTGGVEEGFAIPDRFDLRTGRFDRPGLASRGSGWPGSDPGRSKASSGPDVNCLAGTHAGPYPSQCVGETLADRLQAISVRGQGDRLQQAVLTLFEGCPESQKQDTTNIYNICSHIRPGGQQIVKYEGDFSGLFRRPGHESGSLS